MILCLVEDDEDTQDKEFYRLQKESLKNTIHSFTNEISIIKHLHSDNICLKIDQPLELKEKKYKVNPKSDWEVIYFATKMETKYPCSTLNTMYYNLRKEIHNSSYLELLKLAATNKYGNQVFCGFAHASKTIFGNNIIGKGKSKYPYFMRASAYGKYIKSLISKNKLKKKVTMLGMLSDVEMKSRFLKSSVFVCASVVENSPNSVGEAMLLGVPVVAANAGGIPDMITDGMDGVIFDNMDYKKLAEAILQMWDEPVIAAVYGDNASKRAAKTHNADTNYKRLLEIYDAICRK